MSLAVKFPNNCNNEGSHWSFAYGQSHKLIEWHNLSCSNMINQEAFKWRKSSGFNFKHAATNKALGDSAIEMIELDFFNSKVPDHVHDGEIFYPTGLNKENEGSMRGFLVNLAHKLGDPEMLSPDNIALMTAMFDAELKSKAQVEWKATKEDYYG